ncbi:MAG: hypothetical protein U0263_12145 [Polyangiaceae bacterium]
MKRRVGSFTTLDPKGARVALENRSFVSTAGENRSRSGFSGISG